VAAAPRVDAGGLDERAVGARVGQLFAAHGRMVFAVCRAILRDSDEAEDATQATFLSAHEALIRGAAVRTPGAWLATIARNECRRRVVHRQSEPLPLRVEELADSVTPDDDLERRTTVAHLRAAIAGLPEKQREAVILRDLYGLRYGEICVALGVSRPSVEALLFRARRTLRVRLKPVGGVALGVPLAVREGLAQAVPWFGQGQAAAGASAAAGAGTLAKLAGPVVAKIAVGAVAVGVAGTAAVELDRGTPTPPAAALRVSPREAGPTMTPAGERVVADATESPSARVIGPDPSHHVAPAPRPPVSARAVVAPPPQLARAVRIREPAPRNGSSTRVGRPAATTRVANPTPISEEPTRVSTTTDLQRPATARVAPSPSDVRSATTTTVGGPVTEVDATNADTPTALARQR
jgi:RNA polymerase sigma factor (sigma-70 family)